jgi:Flp pilus assembly protein TadD
MKRLVVLMAAAVLVAGPAFAQDIARGPTPSWVSTAQLEPIQLTTDDTPLRVLLMDQQIHFDQAGEHRYSIIRTVIQNSQGLGQASTISVSWMPPRQTVEVHSARIIRNGQVIDLLASQTFETLRREQNLESAMLDGRLTATLQPRDLRVGDILETAFTIHDDGGVLGAHRETLESAVVGQTVDRYRLRATWPADMTMRARVGEPWTTLQPRRTRTGWEIEIDERNLPPLRLPTDLPIRMQLLRTLELTDFADWGALSAVMAPLYERAAVLEPDSPLLAEIERIRQANPTVEGQIAAAIRLVQDDVRYLALSMGQGGYVPTTADETWRSRYGDCKGKTVLLIALLKGLGVEAEPALVSTQLGDGLNERLPLVSWFDHVIVRATVNGQVYWIDGARVGDRGLESLVPPSYHWALPVRAEGAALEPIVVPPRETPVFYRNLTYDVSAGLDTPARVTGELVFTGDAATGLRSSIARVPPAQMQDALKALWTNQTPGLEVETADAVYDDATNVYRFNMTGSSRMAWTTSSGGRFLAIPDSTISPPATDERKDALVAFKDQPHVIPHPTNVSATVNVRLPYGGAGFRVEGADVDVTAGGYRAERRTTLNDGMVTMTAGLRSLTGEVSAADMAAARARVDSPGAAAVRIRAPSGYRPTEADRARTDVSTSDVPDLLERAEGLVESDDLDGAMTLLNRALELEPDNSQAVLLRGAVRLALSDYAGARADYDHAVDLDPADLEAVMGQGRVAYADGRFTDAVVSFSVAMRLDPADPSALAARGASYYQLRRFDRALSDYRALAAANGHSPASRYGEITALMRLGRRDEARTLIKEMLDESPIDSLALSLLVRLGAEAGAPAEALPPLDRAVETSPEDIGLRSLRAEARIRAGADADARADLEVLRASAHGDPLLMNNLCWTAAVLGFDPEQALADCDAGLAALGESAAIIDSRAMVLLHLGRYEEARAAYEAALAEEPDQLASIYGRGVARLALGDAAGAEDITRALGHDIDAGHDFEAFEAKHPGLRP